MVNHVENKKDGSAEEPEYQQHVYKLPKKQILTFHQNNGNREQRGRCVQVSTEQWCHLNH
jgi:hypothetical protein